MLTEQQFARTQRLALQVAGIELFERHREVLVRRGRRIGVLDSADLEALLGGAEEGEAAATQRFLCLLTTKFTSFFRHPRHFELAARHATEAVRRSGRARMWSAAAATGEEPYSLAIAALEAMGCEHPPVNILGTDVDPEALATARQGEYGELACRTLDPDRRERFFSTVEPGKLWVVAPGARRLVEFRDLNLVSPSWTMDSSLDVIFCRNVLMYLEAGHRRAVVERMARLLAPDGLLMLDPAEHLGESGRLFTPVDSGVYSLRLSSGTNYTCAVRSGLASVKG